MSSLASEGSLCRGRKEGSPQASSWGLSDCGGKRHSYLRQLWQPGPFQAAKCYSKDVKDNGSPCVVHSLCTRAWVKCFVHCELILCPHCIVISPFTDKE